jgi:hypothetical protein
VEVGRSVDGQLAARQDQVEHVVAGLPIRSKEVDSGTFRQQGKSGKPKHASVPSGSPIEDRLGLRYLG